jgi:hypothetical protein
MGYQILSHLFPPFIFLAYLLFLIAVDQLVSKVKHKCPSTNENVKTTKFIIGNIGNFYGIFLGFMVFILWSNHQELENSIISEATELYFVWENSHEFPTAVSQTINHNLHNYVSSIGRDEWVSMANGKASLQTQQAQKMLYSSLLHYQPQTLALQAVYAQSLNSLAHAIELRNSRINKINSPIPTAWYIMACISALFMAVLFALENKLINFSMHVILYVFLSFYLTAITVLSYPFTGFFAFSNQPFQNLISTMNGDNKNLIFETDH